MLSNDRSDSLVKVEAGRITLPPVFDLMCSFFRIAREGDRWFVIHEVRERHLKGVKNKEVYFFGTLIGSNGWHPAILRSFGVAYSCALGKPNKTGDLIWSWPDDWRTLEGYPAPKPGIMRLKRRAAILLDQIKVMPSNPIDKRKGWRQFPYPGYVEFPEGVEAELLFGIDLHERRGFAVYYKSGEVPGAQKLPWVT